MANNFSSLRILYVPLEFRQWHNASHWAYPLNLGFEEGFEALGVKFITAPALYEESPGSNTDLLSYLRQVLGGVKFDQVWLEIVHSQFSDDLLSYFAELSPVRVGLICESLETDPREHTTNSQGTNRRIANTQRNMAFMTHLLCVDEIDAQTLNSKDMRVWWYSNTKMPRRLVSVPTKEPDYNAALFYGALYGERKEWLDLPALKGKLIRPDSSPEMSTEYPALFDKVNQDLHHQLAVNNSLSQSELTEYVSNLRRLRRINYSLWLKGLVEGHAIVNLPTFGKLVPGRITEAMAAGRPVISYYLDGRPLSNQLFVPGEEILLYNRSNPDELAALIDRVSNDRHYRDTIAANGRLALLARHTTELAIEEVLTWIDSGQECFNRKRPDGQPCSDQLSPMESIQILYDCGCRAESYGNYQEACDRYCEVVGFSNGLALFPSGSAIVLKAFIKGLALSESPQFYALDRILAELNLPQEISTFLAEAKSKYVKSESGKLETFNAKAICALDVEKLISGWRIMWHLDRCTDLSKEIKTVETATVSTPSPAPSDLDVMAQLEAAGLWAKSTPLRLHLGCGEQHFDGYVNIDYPPSEHNVMQVAADVFADIRELSFPNGSVDEIRLHHLFEHFNRVTALAMLIKWHGWLKPGGIINIETPDIMGSAKTLVSDAPLKVKMGVVRHLAGDQAASWAYHLDHWFPERYGRTLELLGFGQVMVRSWSWPHEPYLSNVEVKATKISELSVEQLLTKCDELLWDSTVAAAEKPTFETWQKQLRAVVNGQESPAPSNATSPDLSNIALLVTQLGAGSNLPLDEIHDYNQRSRDRWVKSKAATVVNGAKVLDVGAGTCPYRNLFSHCDYKAHDFKKYEGVKLGGTNAYGQIDYVSEINHIPVETGSFDLVLCTEVLEHVPEPIEALREMARIVRPGGRLFITAPLGSGLHQLPFHFYGGYTPEWYKHFAAKFGLTVTEITPNGGFLRQLSQECARVAGTMSEHGHLHGDKAPIVQALFGEILPRYLYGLEEKYFNPQFTVGYHVELVKN